MPRPTIAEIDLSAIIHNVRAIRKKIGPGVEIIGIVKADAYGHGALPVSRALVEEGIKRLAVALVEEAVELRQGGIQTPILILGAPMPDQSDEIVKDGFEVTVSDFDLAHQLDKAARRCGRTVPVHLKFDVGMGRVGFSPDHARDVFTKILALPGLRIAGAMTHFPSADESASAEVTGEQIARFRAIRDQISAAGIRVPCWHCANSGAALLHAESHLDAVRPGIAVYGGFSPEETPKGVEFRQPMTLKTWIAQIRDLPAGSTVSYGRTHRLARPSRVAVLPIGYADGFSRGNSNRGTILVRGRRAPIIGRVCMDLTMADVTDIPGAAPCDEVVLYGRQGNEFLAITDVAAMLGTISYELMTGLTKRVPRRYIP